MNTYSRRTVLATLPALWSLPWLTARAATTPTEELTLYKEFPAQNPERVMEMVGVSHGNTERVRALLKESPELAKATWDWGYGDWESALGAASHVGSREIALMLIDHGARPDIFTFAMLGMLDVVKTYVTAFPGIQKLKGPHGLTLMHHAVKGGTQAEGVVAFLTEAGDADIRSDATPLADGERQPYIGSYKFGDGSNETLDVSVTNGNALVIKKGTKGAARTLYYVGNDEFYPVGAPSVRIRFAKQNGTSIKLSVVDGPLQFIFERV